MKQSINLYQSTLQPEQDAFGFNRALWGLGALVLLLTLYSGYLGYDLYQAQAALDQAQQQLQRQQQTLTQLEDAASGEGQQVLLSHDLKQTENRLKLYNQLIQVLSGPEAAKANFSEVLEGLGRQRVDGVWLTRIELAAGGEQLAIEGQSLAPEHVPQLLLQMKSEPVFGGRTFAELVLERRDEDARVLEFSIRSHLQEDAHGG